jgi:tRNA pseudouridine55 synthase
MARRRKGRDISGWLVLDKPSGLGSTPALARAKYLFDARKAGHAGTLDPLASGILPIAFGEATKTVSMMMDAEKEYECTIEWGIATNTDDSEGIETAQSAHRPSVDDVLAVLPEFIGSIMQVPPAFSAIHKDGERAYKLARRGETPELDARQVRIDDIEVTDHASPDCISLRVSCGKGTYIRAIARDLGLRLGTFGHISMLRRTRVGVFSQNNAIGLEKLGHLGHIAADLVELDSLLLPLETVLDDIPALALCEEQARMVRHGRSIPVASLPSTPIAWAGYQSRAIALGEIVEGQFRPGRIINQPLD